MRRRNWSRRGPRPRRSREGLAANREPGEWRLLSEVLAGLTVAAGGRVAWIEVTAAARQRAGVGLEVTEDFIQYPRNLAGVQIAVAFKEISADEVRVSLRSPARWTWRDWPAPSAAVATGMPPGARSAKGWRPPKRRCWRRPRLS